MDDRFDLDRFVRAQDGVIDVAIGELAAGRKRTHWMWFVFPQLRWLGRSEIARHFGIASIEEARAYLAHPVLGPRLVRATETVLAVNDKSLHAIFGSPDDLKFRSSMTLFAIAADDPGQPFRAALERLCDGEGDAQTIALLNRAPPG